MKIILHTFLCATLLCFAASCSEQVEYRIDETPVAGTFESVSPMTRTQNARSGGSVTSDAVADYFQFRDTDRILICRQDRATGAMTILVDLPWPETENAEIFYSYLSLHGEYLYFMKIQNGGCEWCRVPVDGSAPYEVICTVDNDLLAILYDTGHTYLYMMSAGDNPSRLVPFDEETGEEGTPVFMPGDLTPAFIYEGYVYCYKYLEKNSVYYSQLWRFAIDGSSEPELIWDDYTNGDIQCIADDGKLYICSMDEWDKAIYMADLDGRNSTRILSGLTAVRVLIHNGTMYLHIDTGGEYAAGIYAYDISHRLLSPLYLSDDIIDGPLVTGTDEVWFSTAYTGGGKPFRFGQFHTVTLSGQLRDLSLPASN